MRRKRESIFITGSYEPRRDKVCFKVSKEERRTLLHLAAEYGKTLSEYVRSKCLGGEGD